MAEKIATSAIYKDMVAEGDICKVVKNGTGYQIYVFDRNKYIPFDTNMSFESSYKYLDALRTAIMTIANDTFNKTLLRDPVVQVVVHNSNRVFRKGYKAGYAKYKNTSEIEPILTSLGMCNDLKLTCNEEKANSDSKQTVRNLETALETMTTTALTKTEFEALQAKYDRLIQSNGASPATRS